MNRHLPGGHNQDSHGSGGGSDLLGLADRIKLGDGESLVSSGSLDSGPDAEVLWAVTSTADGRVVRLAVLDGEAVDEWDGTGDLTTTLDRDQVEALRGELEEGAKKSKAYAAQLNKLYDEGDVPKDVADDLYDEPIASGRTGDLRWEMHIDGMDPLSYEVKLHVGDDEADDGKTLEPKDLRKLLKKLTAVSGELAGDDVDRQLEPTEWSELMRSMRNRRAGVGRTLGYIDRAAVRDGDPLRVIMATEGRKADGVDLRMAGADLSRYQANPVLGYGHSYWGRENLPIGRVVPESIGVSGDSLTGNLDFDQGDPFALEIERKMRAGYVNAVSIGFEVLEWENGQGDLWRGGVAEKWLLTELSVVPIGMDEKALVTAGRSGLDAADRELLRALSAEFGAERVLAALTGGMPAPERPAPPVQDPTPATPAGVSESAARALLAAFAKESR